MELIEAVPLNKSVINRFDNCIKLAVAKIVNVIDENIDAIIEVIVTCHLLVILLREKRLNFISDFKTLDYKYGACAFHDCFILPCL